jgi:uncharacterized membrane protein YedE/YeeE
MLLLRDLKVIKYIFTGVAVGLIGVNILVDAGAITKIPSTHPFSYANIAGGIIFGIGIALSGYGPTLVPARLGAGKWEAAIAFAGLYLGAWLFDGSIPHAMEFGLLQPQTQAKTILEILPFDIDRATLGVALGIAFLAIAVMIDKLDPAKKRDSHG